MFSSIFFVWARFDKSVTIEGSRFSIFILLSVIPLNGVCAEQSTNKIKPVVRAQQIMRNNFQHYYDGTAIVTTFKNVREIDTRYTKFYKADVSIIKLPASFVKKLSHEKLIEVVSKDFDFYFQEENPDKLGNLTQK